MYVENVKKWRGGNFIVHRQDKIAYRNRKPEIPTAPTKSKS